MSYTSGGALLFPVLGVSMACARGKANPGDRTKLMLFSHSGGFCQNPECLVRLFEFLPDGEPIHIAEMAHIAAARDDGPRANTDLSEEERGAYENLILLCANCHTKVDKAPDVFTDATIQAWKTEHQRRLDQAFGVRRFTTRAAARNALEPLMVENKLVFDRYGPRNEGHDDPESELAETWHQKVMTTIMPNLAMMVRILEVNAGLLTRDEVIVSAELSQHLADISQRHTSDVPFLGGSRYPAGMATILEQNS